MFRRHKTSRRHDNTGYGAPIESEPLLHENERSTDEAIITESGRDQLTLTDVAGTRYVDSDFLERKRCEADKSERTGLPPGFIDSCGRDSSKKIKPDTTMSTTTTAIKPAFTKLELRTADGIAYRDVSTAAPRDCSPDQVPVIDLSPMFGDLNARKALAQTIKSAAENTGFFYVKNHGISEEIVQAAHTQAKVFFHQSSEKKEKVARSKSKYFNGWHLRRGVASKSMKSKDNIEQFTYCYNPKYDPEVCNSHALPAEVKASLPAEEFIWEGTTHLPNFQKDCVKYWQENLQLARRLLRIFALSLDLPEEYFDKLVTYPGSDSAFNYYPGLPEDSIVATSLEDVGLGAHTDIQCFTILWQDMIGGLQVLMADGSWVKAPPIPGTFVVNIGDYLMRLTNDRFKSTVHRVFMRTTSDRYSMPFFFGFNFNEKCSVLPSCTSEDVPAKYEPISCGEYVRRRLNYIYVPPEANRAKSAA